MDDTFAQTRAPAAPRFYHSTNRISAGLFVWLPVVGGLGALLLGTVYAFIASIIHELEESFWLILVTPFFAAGLGMIGQWVCQLGRVRRRRLRLPIALFVGAMGLYAAWHVYLSIGGTWRMSPPLLWHAMRGLAEDQGAGSWLLWLLEAATVFGFIVYLMSDSDPEVPFCERCGHWTNEALAFQLHDGSYGPAMEAFKQGRVEHLLELGPKKHGAKTFLQVRVLQCPCSAAHFASLERVTVKPGKKGGVRYGRIVSGGQMKLHYDLGSFDTNDVQPLVENMEIDAAMQQKLQTVQAELRKAE